MSAPREDRVTKDTPNPANPAEPRPRRRIPMSTQERRLEVDPLPGFHLHWIRETNVPRALDAGYELVDAKEVHINNTHTYGGLKAAGGNTDLGSNVSVVADRATGERLILMKLREELWLEDREVIDNRHAQIMGGIFSGETIIKPDGTPGPKDSTTYVSRALFNRPTRKIRLMGGNAPNPAALNARNEPVGIDPSRIKGGGLGLQAQPSD